MLPYEFIIRGYMFGSMWKAYKKGEPFCGQTITGDYQLAQKLEKPLLTPSTKATEGHDEYSVTHEGMVQDLGADLTRQLEEACLAVYEKCYNYAYDRGIIIADTKLEFGLDEAGDLVLADEVSPGLQPLLEQGGVPGGHLPLKLRQAVPAGLAHRQQAGRRHPRPDLPAEVVEKTREKYLECLQLLVPQK